MVNELSKSEQDIMRRLFTKYCRSEIEKGMCQEGDCEYCSIDGAYDRMFNLTNDDE